MVPPQINSLGFINPGLILLLSMKKCRFLFLILKKMVLASQAIRKASGFGVAGRGFPLLAGPQDPKVIFLGKFADGTTEENAAEKSFPSVFVHLQSYTKKQYLHWYFSSFPTHGHGSKPMVPYLGGYSHYRKSQLFWCSPKGLPGFWPITTYHRGNCH